MKTRKDILDRSPLPHDGQRLLLEVLLDIRDQLDGLYALIAELRPGAPEART